VGALSFKRGTYSTTFEKLGVFAGLLVVMLDIEFEAKTSNFSFYFYY